MLYRIRYPEHAASGAVHKRLRPAPPRAAAPRRVRRERVAHHRHVGRLVREHLVVLDALPGHQPRRGRLLPRAGGVGDAVERGASARLLRGVVAEDPDGGQAGAEGVLEVGGEAGEDADQPALREAALRGMSA